MLVVQGCAARAEWPFAREAAEQETTTFPEHVCELAGWRIRVVCDHSHVVEVRAGGLLIHDRRCRTAGGDDAGGAVEYNGAFLHFTEGEGGALSVRTDRIASIPLYWGCAHGHALFSSRLLDMVKAGFTQPDPLGVYQWVLLGQPLGVATPLAGVKALPNASDLQLSPHDGVRSAHAYWQLPELPEEQGEVAASLDDAIDVLRAAHARAQPLDGARLALPVTGGFDSRCNLALWQADVPQSVLFHTEDLGRYELPIAHEIAARYGRSLVVYSSSDWMSQATRLDLRLETGEFNAAHWRLADSVHRLAQAHGAQATVDGFFQDYLFKASFVSNAPPQRLFDAQMNIARYRASFLEIGSESEVLRTLAESVAQATLVEPAGWNATQRYYVENRSRRLVYNIVRLNQNYLDVRTPGLDHELIDFALALPRNLRQNALLYRHIINRLDPALARIRYDKSGLPVMDLRKRSWLRRLRGPLMRNLNHLLPDRRFLRESETNFSRLLRESADFRAQLDAHVSASSWARALFGERIIPRLEAQRRKGRPVDDMVGALVTLAALEAQGRQEG